MECPVKERKNTDVLMDYCAGLLEPSTSAVLENHIAGCPACDAWVNAQRRMLAALDAWEAPPVSETFDRTLQERIRAEETAPRWWKRLAGLPSLRPALSLALASLLVMVAFLLHPPKSQAPSTPAAVHVETLDPDRLEKALDDVEMLQQLNFAATSDPQSM
jgi:anti-sigma factor RsiW